MRAAGIDVSMEKRIFKRLSRLSSFRAERGYRYAELNLPHKPSGEEAMPSDIHSDLSCRPEKIS